MCDEDANIRLNDGAKRIFLNTHGTNRDEVSPELIAFLEYMESSSEKPAKQSESENLAYIQDYIGKLKASKEIGVEYMQSWEKERMLREEGKQQQLVFQVCKKMIKGQTVEEIAEALEEDVECIRTIYETAVNFAPDYDKDEIYNALYEDEE